MEIEVLEHVDAPTRQRVARAILEHGPSTAATLAELLDLTPAAIRRHLDHLLATGAVVAQDARTKERRRGRPAKEFALTAAGRDQFEQQYDDLAAQALRFLSQTAGDDAVLAFARQRLSWVEEAVADVRAADPSLSAPQALAQVLRTHGFAAGVLQGPMGEQLCQQHCPVAHVAHEFPQLCEAETEVFSRVLGSHVQRLATIAHGDGVCTTSIPARTTPHPTPSERRSS
ncbi:helix-turn-helix transcriptional regulator [Nocardioides marmoribigeumensis]|uniref:ArsR family transcriptional regulator n=1 Tax=Nocardioides marmoribigeumensis TaxID=433649 RepID=A0ABU2C1E0_9ACTN|nr:helix-turn-helix domain-containing protein [Nocardioides marmoribigeumensis]MDR7364484.1 putative ArsR family transcriptional regulator [Nocardioides marmoribigeumensis]